MAGFTFKVIIAVVTIIAGSIGLQAQNNTAETIVIKAGLILDGLGQSVAARDIIVRDGKIIDIVEAGKGEGSRVLDWSEYTVMPGIIDTHVHLGWHFGPDGRWDIDAKPKDHVLYATENAYSMMKAGVTTVQSLGGPEDGPVRDMLNRGLVPGPRVLTSMGALFERTGDPDAMRERVRELKAEGADVIKIFGSESIRTGGAPNLSQEQLDAACGEAKQQGLRAVVHAHGPEAALRASRAGCNAVEHGALLDRKTLVSLAENGTYYAPHTHLIFQNYFDNQDRYSGIGNFNEAGFEGLQAAIPKSLEAFKAALTVPNLNILFGTDAVAGAHGRNMEELIYRVNVGGQPAMDALVSATSLAATSLNMGDQIGTIAPGYLADLIAIKGNPHQDIEALNNVDVVMINGEIRWTK
ncbi:amidohydrolase family protein [Kordiimonas aquimaris]|uniref:amidohydrolase family protein n=1 Tax=Kordiimonas aquimaris TaxID=707591 RepID=UPI0021D2DDD7|nr:amidohydrolase family protein [Kordiimonas aquimaris]